jgi:hypothetical protein
MGQAFGLYLHRHESMPGKFRAKGRPISTDFGLVAAKLIGNLRGDAEDMNTRLVLAATCRRIYRHSNLIRGQSAARHLLDEVAGVPSSLSIV